MWPYALLLPDPKDGWAWATRSLLGLPHLVRVLVTLHRAGIREVSLPPNSAALRHWFASCHIRADVPVVGWWDETGWPDGSAASPILGVRGGILFTPQLLVWFHEVLAGASMGKALRHAGDTMPVLVSFTPEALDQHQPQPWTCTHLASYIATPTISVPPDVFCHTVQELEQPRRDRKFLSTVGKPTDRWHVEWVRRWTFPALRWLARVGVKPNHISGVGCGVALIACWLIAQGGYWAGIWGALLLYVSWVLDCMDGTLARLTLAESAFGQKLDTVLGHLSNLCIFAALLWAVYGEEPAWKGVVMALFILGGIVVAQRLSAVGKKIHRQCGTSRPNRLHAFLEKINHRDYAVLIFVLAVVKGFHIFLWLSLIGIQVYWVLQLWLLRQRARTAAQT